MNQRHLFGYRALLFIAIALSTGLLLSGPSAGKSGKIQKNSFDSDGVTIHYQVEGEGQPLLLIHGYRASGNMNWRLAGVNRALADGYKVITIDNRGHGASDKPTNPEAYGRNMVLDQVRLLDHLGIKSAHVAGYSMGGMIALRMLVDHPERIRSAAICGMGWTKDDEATRKRFATVPSAQGQRKTSDVYTAVRQAWGDLGISREQLEAIKNPIITIVGDNDGLYQSSVKPLREVRPDVPLVLIEGASHTGAPLKATFHRALRTWVDSQAVHASAQ